MTTLWIIVLVFIAFAVVAAAVQLLAAFADRRRAREIEADESRPHPEGGHGQEGAGWEGTSQTGPGSGGPDWNSPEQNGGE